MIVKLLTEHHFEFLSLKGGCIGLSESTLVKMPHCWNLMPQLNYSLLFPKNRSSRSATIVISTINGPRHEISNNLTF